MKIISILIMVAISLGVQAKSNLAGVWINEGKTLSVQIVDDPSEAPFTAGELWNAMVGISRTKIIKTQNLELKCDGTLDNGTAFGSCKLKVTIERIENVGSKPDYLFSVVDEEAKDILSKFNQGSKKFLLVYEKENKEFRLEANWEKQTFGFLIYNELVGHE